MGPPGRGKTWRLPPQQLLRIAAARAPHKLGREPRPNRRFMVSSLTEKPPHSFCPPSEPPCSAVGRPWGPQPGDMPLQQPETLVSPPCPRQTPSQGRRLQDRAAGQLRGRGFCLFQQNVHALRARSRHARRALGHHTCPTGRARPARQDGEPSSRLLREHSFNSALPLSLTHRRHDGSGRQQT